jgi:hypothetical protein
MGFVNGINVCLLLATPMIIVNKARPVVGKAVFAGVVLCFIAVVLRAALPLPDALRTLLPLEALVIGAAVAFPRAFRRVPLIGPLSNEERRDGLATGLAIGRFVFESNAKMWAALAVPGFAWDSVVYASLFAVSVVACHAALTAALAVRAQGPGPVFAAAAAVQVAVGLTASAVLAGLGL